MTELPITWLPLGAAPAPPGSVDSTANGLHAAHNTMPTTLVSLAVISLSTQDGHLTHAVAQGDTNDALRGPNGLALAHPPSVPYLSVATAIGTIAWPSCSHQLTQLDRDRTLIEELQLEPRYVLSTQVHADHVTSGGMLRDYFGAKTNLSDARVSCVYERGTESALPASSRCGLLRDRAQEAVNIVELERTTAPDPPRLIQNRQG